jgi:hypothetical protein
MRGVGNVRDRQPATPWRSGEGTRCGATMIGIDIERYDALDRRRRCKSTVYGEDFRSKRARVACPGSAGLSPDWNNLAESLARAPWVGSMRGDDPMNPFPGSGTKSVASVRLCGASAAPDLSAVAEMSHSECGAQLARMPAAKRQCTGHEWGRCGSRMRPVLSSIGLHHSVTEGRPQRRPSANRRVIATSPTIMFERTRL